MKRSSLVTGELYALAPGSWTSSLHEAGHDSLRVARFVGPEMVQDGLEWVWESGTSSRRVQVPKMVKGLRFFELASGEIRDVLNARLVVCRWSDHMARMYEIEVGEAWRERKAAENKGAAEDLVRRLGVLGISAGARSGRFDFDRSNPAVVIESDHHGVRVKSCKVDVLETLVALVEQAEGRA